MKGNLSIRSLWIMASLSLSWIRAGSSLRLSDLAKKNQEQEYHNPSDKFQALETIPGGSPCHNLQESEWSKVDFNALYHARQSMSTRLRGDPCVGTRAANNDCNDPPRQDDSSLPFSYKLTKPINFYGRHYTTILVYPNGSLALSSPTQDSVLVSSRGVRGRNFLNDQEMNLEEGPMITPYWFTNDHLDSKNDFTREYTMSTAYERGDSDGDEAHASSRRRHDVWYKQIDSSTFAIAFDNVGSDGGEAATILSRVKNYLKGAFFKNKDTNKLRNTRKNSSPPFQILLSDGTDPRMGFGNNVCVCYGGDDTDEAASSWNAKGISLQGVTVGQRQLSSTSSSSSSFRVPLSRSSSFSCFDGGAELDDDNEDNIPPVAVGFPIDNTFHLIKCERLDATVRFISPEADQTIAAKVNDEDNDFVLPTGLDLTFTTREQEAEVHLNWFPVEDGAYILPLVATDSVGYTVKRNLTIFVSNCDDLAPSLASKKQAPSTSLAPYNQTGSFGGDWLFSRRLQATLLPFPMQTYYVPLPEDELLFIGGGSTFEQINTAAGGNVETIVAIGVLSSNSRIWIDHVEDGYDIDVTNSVTRSSTTEVWGDGDLTNGVAPGYPSDIIPAGAAIIYRNEVPPPSSRPSSSILIEGGDKILSSEPITVVRGAYTTATDSLMAGATEVHRTEEWGTTYVVPVGEDSESNVLRTTDAFQYSALYIQAKEANTNVNLPGGGSVTLNEGETHVIRVDAGDTVTADKPVQASLLTGDIGSNYELRWYSIPPRDQWSDEYVTPVGHGTGNTRAWLYNPGNNPLTVNYEYGNGPSAGITSGTITVPAGGNSMSPPIPTNSGARFYSNGQDFFALTQTDAKPLCTPGFLNPCDGAFDDDSLNLNAVNGETWDWGHPLIPISQLTSQALVGWGYGCTNPSASCSDSSVVWISPVVDSTITVEVGGTTTTYNVDALDSIRVFDTSTHDMSGAIITAVVRGGANDGEPSAVAVAWGQDPSRADAEVQNLDLGTVVLPMPLIDSAKTSSLLIDNDGDGLADVGDVILYTIRTLNSGTVDIPAGSITVLDPLPSEVEYIAGSTTFTLTDNSAGGAIPDDSTPDTLFPIDEGGWALTHPLAASESLYISFQVTVTTRCETVVNTVTSTFDTLADVSEVVTECDPTTPSPSVSTFPSTTPSQPTDPPSNVPSLAPSDFPSASNQPSENPSAIPSNLPSIIPSHQPSDQPSNDPSSSPSQPTDPPSNVPSLAPSDFPSASIRPSENPSALQSNLPSIIPSDHPSDEPSSSPSDSPSQTLSVDITIETLTNGIDADTVPEGPDFLVGQPVVWTYVVTNSGSLPLDNVVVVDSQGVFVTCGQTTLAVGESINCTSSGTVAAGQYQNIGSVDASHTDGGGVVTPVSDSDPTNHNGLEPFIDITNQFTEASVSPGATGSFVLTVTNNGTVPLTNVNVFDNIDPRLDVSSVSGTSGSPSDTDGDDQTLEWLIGDLAIGEVMTITVEFLALADVNGLPNSASVTGTYIDDFGNIAAPSDEETDTISNNNAGGGGDPHFNAWRGKRYSYHGECDLVMARVDDFGDGTGLLLHVRTTMTQIKQQTFSYISDAALRIGDDVLEVNGNDYYVNGRRGAELPLRLADSYMLIRYVWEVKGVKRVVYEIDLSNSGGGLVKIMTYEKYVIITFRQVKDTQFYSSIGLLGTFFEGSLMARDGLTVLEDYDEFGSEWQVHRNEPKLFQSLRAPQHPAEGCRLPPEAVVGRRRLGASYSSEDELAAKEACAHRTEDMEFCIFDVLQTGDLGLAIAGEV